MKYPSIKLSNLTDYKMQWFYFGLFTHEEYVYCILKNFDDDIQKTIVDNIEPCKIVSKEQNCSQT